ncbi:MAG: hypothetical protein ACRCX7_11195 [Cetobacterium sp.]|uniref:hypothetical protein n=1 Tax=Cetobacterium sp. TaxID=2071632 RepID=UPI003F3F97C0
MIVIRFENGEIAGFKCDSFHIVEGNLIINGEPMFDMKEVRDITVNGITIMHREAC